MTREEAKEVFLNRGFIDGIYDGDKWREACIVISKWLEQEPKTGHWVHGEYCSECGCDVPAYIIDWKWQKDMNVKYCPNCGAKMEGKVEE